MVLPLVRGSEMTVRVASTVGDRATRRAPRLTIMRTASSSARGLLTAVPQSSAEPPADLDRSRMPAAGTRKSAARHDGAVLHIIQQYPGCNDARILAFLRTRVHWFGRGTMVDRLFRPSLRTIRGAVHRLELAGDIKTNVQQSPEGRLVQFFPNVPIWPGSGR